MSDCPRPGPGHLLLRRVGFQDQGEPARPISSVNRAVTKTFNRVYHIPTSYMKLRLVNPQALPDESHDRLRLWASEPRYPHHFRPE
jgi:hypothetical protein